MFLLPMILALLSADVAAAALPQTFTVTNTNTSGAGSLQQAILNANLTGPIDNIEFNIPGGGIKTIGGTLPVITAPVSINGYTQPDSSENLRTDGGTDAVLNIELDASGVNLFEPMLKVTSANTTIRGIAIKGIKAKATGIEVADTAVSGVSIFGCFVGTGADGVADLSSGVGITVRGTASIGSLDFGDRNLISGNTVGIDLRGPSSIIQNNLIGTNAAGDPVLGNGIGISMSTATADGNTVGGTGIGAGNVIAGNVNDGIRVLATATGTNRIRPNSIHDNGGLGIDLLDDGVTPNDEGDLDSGPNNLQNYPVLTFARVNAATLTVEGYLQSGPGTYRLEFFANTSTDPSGFGEGETFLGGLTLATADNPDPMVPFRATFDLGSAPATPVFVSAAAQNIDEAASSEFSRTIEALDGGAELTVTNTNDSGAGSLRQAILTANGNADSNTVVFDIPDANPQVLTPATALLLTQPVILDGYTQPGSSRNSMETGSNAQIGIVIDGSGLAPLTKVAIVTTASNTVLRGIAIHSAPGTAIGINGEGDVFGVRVEGCFVGTDETGMNDLGNRGAGIVTTAGPGTLSIGGPHAAQRNIISGNGRAGVVDVGTGTLILNNIIGGDATGAGDLGNDEQGIFVNGSESIIGGEDAVSGNVIRANALAGILVVATGVANDAGNQILANSIRDNGGLGIDLLSGEAGTPGVNDNDIDDVDGGANDGQNFPEILGTTSLPGSFKIDAKLDVPAGTVNATYTIRFFASIDCDSSGHGEGQSFLGAADVVLSDGADEFLVDLPVSVKESAVITATATDVALGNTSEFSECFGGAAPSDCGDANGDTKITSPDALLALRAAVGIGECELCRCDVNSLNGITSGDALLVLRAAVDQPVELVCVPCT